MDYSDSQFGRMQEEALRRVREMQQRSRSAVGQDSPPPPPPEKPDGSDEREKTKKTSSGKFLQDLLGDINIDEEKALIALLIFILYKQGADIKLLLGLAYLLI